MAGRENSLEKAHFSEIGVVLKWRFHTSPINAATFASKGFGGYTRHPSPEPRTQRLTGRNRGVFTARDIGRVDRVNSLDTLCIVTFGTAQLNEPLAVAAAHHGRDANFA